MTPVPIAFYAPLKPPDHPHPSGDRTMARLLLAALKEAGFAPEVASRLRTFEAAGNRERQIAIAAESAAEADVLAAEYGGHPAEARPRLWFTYHCYYKAPDHLGPEMARRLGIPLVIVEPSRAPKRASGPWAFAHRAAEAAIAAADALLVLTGRDRECLERALRPGQRLVELPPFVDVRPATRHSPGRKADAPTRLLTVAMMRPGDKLASYRILGAALSRIADLPWTLDVVGDGAARPEVEGCLAPLGMRVTFRGELDGEALSLAYAAADLLVWPAVNEAYGMVLLEAQAQGCPVLAGRYGGVADAMLAGVTGELVPPGDVAAFADAAARLIKEPARRAGMGEAGSRFVAEERSLSRAAASLREALAPLLALPSPA